MKRNSPAGRWGPEADLLICSARVCIDPPTAGRIRDLVRHPLDWAHLLRSAETHGVLPLLCRGLLATCPEAVPPAVLEQLRKDLQRNTVRNLFLAGELVRLLELFEAQDIRAIPFKGPTLAACAHGNLALRQFNDLDLLLRAEDIPRARGLLLSWGYRLALDVTPAQEVAYLQAFGQLPLVRDDGDLLVELHSALMARAFPFRLDHEHLRDRLVPTVVAGKEVPTLAAEELLLVLCVHGGKHAWCSLGWICDVAELLRAHPDLDWERVMTESRQLAIKRLLLLGLFLAGDLLEAALPEAVRRRARADAVVRGLAAQVRRNLFRGRPGTWTWPSFSCGRGSACATGPGTC
jgi:hypothetical protein